MRYNYLIPRVVFSILLASSFFILLITGNVLILINEWYLRWEYSRLEPNQRLEPEERLKLSKRILRFIKGQVELREIEGELNQREIRHLRDVRDLVHKIKILNYLALLTLSMILIFNKKRMNFVMSIISISSGIFLLFLSISLFLISLKFDYFFIKFHELVFPGGFWWFGEEDTLIQLYPEKFWKDFTLIIISSLLVENIFIFTISLLTNRRNLK